MVVPKKGEKVVVVFFSFVLVNDVGKWLLACGK